MDEKYAKLIVLILEFVGIGLLFVFIAVIVEKCCLKKRHKNLRKELEKEDEVH